MLRAINGVCNFRLYVISIYIVYSFILFLWWRLHLIYKYKTDILFSSKSSKLPWHLQPGWVFIKNLTTTRSTYSVIGNYITFHNSRVILLLLWYPALWTKRHLCLFCLFKRHLQSLRASKVLMKHLWGVHLWNSSNQAGSSIIRKAEERNKTARSRQKLRQKAVHSKDEHLF